MAGFFDDATLDIPCKNCGHKMTQTIRRLKTSPNLTCPACSTVNQIDASQFAKEVGGADKAIDDLKRAFKKFGK